MIKDTIVNVGEISTGSRLDGSRNSDAIAIVSIFEDR